MVMNMPFRSQCRGFTLVEILTAVTVLAFLSVMLVQIISVAIQETNTTLHAADTVSQTRFLLDRFGNDWDSRLRRSDIPLSCLKNPGNDTLSFFSGVNGFTGSSVRPQISQVDYYVNPGNATVSPYVQRGVLNMSWTSTNNPLPMGTSNLSLIFSQGGSASTSDYQTVSDDTFRLEVCFVLRSTGHISASQPSNLQDIGAVIVSVASLDRATRAHVAVSQINTLVNNLADAADGLTTTPVDATPADLWKTYLQGASGMALPKAIVQNIHIDQRYYYIR